MKKLLLSAAILTAFVVDAKAMVGEGDCPDKHSLRVAIGKLPLGDISAKTIEFTDASGKKWRGSNIKELASRTNLATGAEPTFTHVGTQCHVSYDKVIDTPEGKDTGVSTILTLDLTQE